MMEDDTPMTKKKPVSKPKPKPKVKPKAYSASKGVEVTNKGKMFRDKIPFEGASGYSVGDSGPAKGAQAGGPSTAKAGKAGSPGRKTYTDVAGFLNIHKS